MNHYLFKYSIEKSKELFLDKRISSVSIYSPSSFKIEFSGIQYGLYVNVSPQNSFLFPTIFSLKATKINDVPFLVFLKKRLAGLVLCSIEQKNSERVAYFELEDRRGNIINRFILIFELMDRRSNAIFVNEKKEILQAYKHLNLQRQIMPHKLYIPPFIDMPDLLTENIERLVLRFQYGEDILGLNRTLREFAKNKEDFVRLVSVIRHTFEKKDFSLCVFKKRDVYPFCLDSNQKKVDEKFIFDTFILKPKLNEFENRKKNIKNILKKRLNSLKRRLKKVELELDKSENADKFRIFAENLLANPTLNIDHKASVTLKDIYSQKNITIPLNPDLNLFQNAQNYFKKFKKAKKSMQIVEKRLKETVFEIEFIEQLLFDIESAKDEKDLESVKEVMIKESIIRLNQNKQKHIEFKPYEHIKIGEFDVYIGKNAKGNDYVTLKLASKNDLWFHPKGRPGAHLVLKNPARLQKIDDNVKMACASEVAKRSKATKGERIEVDYTFIKYVKKPKGFKTGMVIYSNFKTLVVEKV